jgi:hypothetical protein
VNIVVPNTKSNDEEDNTGSSSGSMNAEQAATTLIKLVTANTEEHKFAALYNTKSLPVHCYVKGTRTLIEAKYRTHILDSLIVNDVKMIKRTVPDEAVSFYECLLLIKKQREKPSEPHLTRPNGIKKLAIHWAEVKEVRHMVHKIILEELDVDIYETKLLALVQSWRKQELTSTYPMVPDCDLRKLISINSFGTYTVNTDYDWFQIGEIEVSAAVEALKVNLLVWDMVKHTYHNFNKTSNKEWCILIKSKYRYELMCTPDNSNSEGCRLFRFNTDMFGKEVKCIFSMYEDEEIKNYGYYYGYDSLK